MSFHRLRIVAAAVVGLALLSLPGAAAVLLLTAAPGGRYGDPPALLRTGPPYVATRQPEGSAPTICFYRDLEFACVQRFQALTAGQDDEHARARALLEAMLAGPTQAERAQGVYSALPDGAQLYDVDIAGSVGIVKLVLPESFLYGGFDPLSSDMIVHQVSAALESLDLRTLTIQALDRQGNFRRLSYFLFEPPPRHKHESRSTNHAARNTYHAARSLDGKAVYVSAGHGWYWSQHNDWRTQRYKYQGIVEDFNNAEVVNQYLVQYLRNAGADVWTVREHDINTQQIIIRRDSPDYSDQGPWVTGGGTGYGGVNPRYAVVASTATATATWTFTPSVSGRYAVYVWYRHGEDRAPDAQYLVCHAGDTTEARLDQTVHGYTWRYLGTYPFAAGLPAHVLLTNQSHNPGRRVIADAVRIGGGMGSERGDTPPGYVSSGRPRWEEAARYWAKYQGAPPDVYDPVTVPCVVDDDYCDDVTARPLYAEWEKPFGEEAVYISWHTNGYNGEMRGTESYIYDGDFTPGSDALQSMVHSALINDIRAGWDPNWTDQGMKRRDLGEVRRLSTIPGVLLEIAFHDQVTDTNALKDPRFEMLAARAVYKGTASYFATRDGTTPVFLPEPPKALAARNVAPGTVRLGWLPSPTDTVGLLGHAARSYRVYTSRDGFGWSNGIVVTGTAYTLTNLSPGQLIFARVTGVNAGGESFPTPVVGARVGWPALVLIVDGFGRIDRRGLILQDDGGSLGNNYRMFLDRINSFDYVVRHGTAISLPFDSANRRALGVLPIALDSANYPIVDWIAGEEQSQSDPLPPNAPEITLSNQEQAVLQSYLASGGSLFISGAELGYDLVSKGQGAAFYGGVMKATYLGDDADSYTVAPLPGSIFEGLPEFRFDDQAVGSYDADWPDYFTPISGAASALTYVGGQGSSAALHYDSGACSRLVYFGFPFETIYDQQVRGAVMERVVAFLGACVERQPETLIQSPKPGRYYDYTPPIKGTASDETGQVASVRLQIISGTNYWDGMTWLPSPAWMTASGTATWSYTLPLLLADGWYTVTAQARNTLGFLDNTPASVAFAIDTIPPTVPIPITPTGGITVAGVGTTFIYSPSYDANGIVGYMITLDDGDRSATTDGTVFKSPFVLADGEHAWTVKARDRAGNISVPSAPATFVTVSEHVYLPLVLRDE